MAVLLIIVGLIFGLIWRLAFSDDGRIEEYPAKAVVLKRMHTDGGVEYRVAFTDRNGQMQEARSVHYHKTFGRYHAGETVDIYYYFSPNGRCYCRLNDPELENLRIRGTRFGRILVSGISLLCLGAGAVLILNSVLQLFLKG